MEVEASTFSYLDRQLVFPESNSYSSGQGSSFCVSIGWEGQMWQSLGKRWGVFMQGFDGQRLLLHVRAHTLCKESPRVDFLRWKGDVKALLA